MTTRGSQNWKHLPGKWQMRDCDSTLAKPLLFITGMMVNIDSVMIYNSSLLTARKVHFPFALNFSSNLKTQSPGTSGYFLLLKKFAPAQDKDEFFLVTAALNQKHNNSNRYKNKEMRAGSHHPRAADKRSLSSLRPRLSFPWDPYPSSVFAFMHQLTFWLFPKAFGEK